MDSIQDDIRFIKQRNQIFRNLENLAEERGFLRVESDYFEECLPYLAQNKRQDPSKLIKVQDLQGRLYLLRPDITTNIIKQVIPRIDEAFETEFYYLESVFSYGEDGRLAQTRQFGVEVIGKESIDADLALIRLIDDIFASNELSLVLEIGNQKWIERLIVNLNLSGMVANRLRQAIIAKNMAEVRRLLVQDSPYKTLLLDVLTSEKELDQYLKFVTDKKLDTELGKELERMKTMEQAIGNGHILFDLSLIQPFDYYNGPIFKGYLQGSETDIVRGGRYDTLTEEYGRLTPALGFSLDVDRLVQEVVRRG